MGKIKDMTNRRFGKLVVEKYNGLDKDNNATWLCRCDCGNIKVINGKLLRNKHTVSCGCHRANILATSGFKHGLKNTKLYDVWEGMKQRCSNPKHTGYKYYGARGIKVCKEWKDNFKIFYEWATNNGYKQGLSIDRIDVNGDYTPSNCRWVTMAEQNKNKRKNKIRV